MTTEDRNYLFEEKAHLINITMNRHRTLIRACRMDEDDVYQELSLRLLNALGKYNPVRCSNMDAYLMLQLRYHLWNMKACSKLTGVAGAPKKGFSLLSLDAREADGFFLPTPSNDDSNGALWLEKEIDALPKKQRSVIFRIVSGQRVAHNNKSLAAHGSVSKSGWNFPAACKPWRRGIQICQNNTALSHLWILRASPAMNGWNTGNTASGRPIWPW